MNSGQREHVRNRINAIREKKIGEVNRLYWISELKLSKTQKYALVRSGKVRLLSDVELTANSRYEDGDPHLFAAFDFKPFQKPGHSTKPEKHKKLLAKIEAHAARVMDVAMLVSGEKALGLLEEFEAMVFA